MKKTKNEWPERQRKKTKLVLWKPRKQNVLKPSVSRNQFQMQQRFNKLKIERYLVFLNLEITGHLGKNPFSEVVRTEAELHCNEACMASKEVEKASIEYCFKKHGFKRKGENRVIIMGAVNSWEFLFVLQRELFKYMCIHVYKKRQTDAQTDDRQTNRQTVGKLVERKGT